LGRNDKKSCNLTTLEYRQASEYLSVFDEVWTATASLPELHKDVGERIAELSSRGGWGPADIVTLLKLQTQLYRQGQPFTADAAEIEKAIAADKLWGWFELGAKIWVFNLFSGC
jgi:hypothetical protein